MDSPEFEYLKKMVITQNVQMDELKAILSMLLAFEGAKLAERTGLPLETITAEIEQQLNTIRQDTRKDQHEFRRRIYDLLSQQKVGHTKGTS